MEKVILFGGTFDPPHNGHLCLLRTAIAAVQPQRVVIMPTGLPPHKAAGQTPCALRMEMCRCFLPLFPTAQISDLEILRTGKSFTIDTVRTLQAQMPTAQIYLPMGSDMLLYFRQWAAWEQLMRLVTLVVHCRARQDLAPVQALADSLVQQGARVLLVQGEVQEVSSTEIREKVAAGQNIAALVPPEVQQIITQHGLYTPQANGENFL